jgi:hypothetical protein
MPPIFSRAGAAEIPLSRGTPIFSRAGATEIPLSLSWRPQVAPKSSHLCLIHQCATPVKSSPSLLLSHCWAPPNPNPSALDQSVEHPNPPPFLGALEEEEEEIEGAVTIGATFGEKEANGFS